MIAAARIAPTAPDPAWSRPIGAHHLHLSLVRDMSVEPEVQFQYIHAWLTE